MSRDTVRDTGLRPPLAIVAALSSNGVIGRDNALPWHLPADLQHFKRLTFGKPVLMGRKTHQSIGRPLPGRENIVISRNRALAIAGCQVCASLEDALILAYELQPQMSPMVIGGGQLYRQALPLAHCLHLTRVHADVEGDTFFPAIDLACWDQVQRQDHRAIDDSDWDYSFIDYRRIPGRDSSSCVYIPACKSRLL